MDFKLNKSNLNFRVYTATTTPTTGKENDIAIITATPMENWVMSPDAPRGIPRCDGDVWLMYSIDGDMFNAVKSGIFRVRLDSAYQFVNGFWNEVSHTAFHDGKWSDIWKGEIFRNGEQYADITGGWGNDGFIYYRSSEYVNSSPTIGETIKVDASRTIGTSKTTSIAGTQKQIDLTGYNTLSLDVLSVTGECYLVATRDSTGNTSSMYALKSVPLSESGKVEVDISDITGAAKIAIVAVYSYESPKNVCEVNNIKLS